MASPETEQLAQNDEAKRGAEVNKNMNAANKWAEENHGKPLADTGVILEGDVENAAKFARTIAPEIGEDVVGRIGLNVQNYKEMITETPETLQVKPGECVQVDIMFKNGAPDGKARPFEEMVSAYKGMSMEFNAQGQLTGPMKEMNPALVAESLKNSAAISDERKSQVQQGYRVVTDSTTGGPCM